MVEFPEGFLLGAATSSYQIEGGTTEGGRGPSIWDDLCRVPGAIADGSDGSVAADHFHRWREDVALMRDLGLQAYRFSIAWPRVQPGGKGPLNPEGVAFYDRLVDALLENGIAPFATLYHWDLPSELQAAGGWPERETADRFADYAAAMAEALGDRVQAWATLNEPWCSAWLGYGAGVHAPGIRDHRLAVRAAHHLLLGHGRAVAAMRAVRPETQLGIVCNFLPVRLSDGASEAARLSASRVDQTINQWFAGAALDGRYPEDLSTYLAPALDEVLREGDLAEIAQPLDWFGVNYYNDGFFQEASTPGPDDQGSFPGAGAVTGVEPDVRTDIGWPITPEGLGALLRRLRDEHPTLPPVYITENGAAYDDPMGPDGSIDDARRLAFLDGHLRSLLEAVRDGVDVRGYFAWSLLDNFEWAEGYRMRFGIVHVDYETQQRTPRRSALWYRDVIRQHALPEEPFAWPE